jgi:cytochrome c5
MAEGACALCAAAKNGAGVYDFGCSACRDRFITGEPRLAVRRAWLDQFERTHGAAEVDRLKGVLERHFRSKGWTA